MKEEDKQEVRGMIAEAFQFTPKGDVFINGATVTIATPVDAEAFWNERSELVKRFSGRLISKAPIEDGVYELKKKLTLVGNELVKVISNLDRKAVELGVFNDSGIGLELDELAGLASKLFNLLEIKETTAGTVAEKNKSCSNCGHLAREKAFKYCTRCGSKLDT
ncbi:zinc ribbon domain-containing protein [Paenibacillus sp. FSL R7-0048]|uniref:zinc ribbon domain-containing protein n=1 Tax=Paenibacillus sp. FSL R7-0048 TaxID=2954528 RepID=UPI0030F63707